MQFQGAIFDQDEFLGENAPLVTAEIELPSAETLFAKPSLSDSGRVSTMGRPVTTESREAFFENWMAD